jgi:hypothetical protein
VAQTNAERQRAYRERRRHGVTESVTRNGVMAVTKSEGPRPEELTPHAEGAREDGAATGSRSRACRNCQALADEVARLKKELAAARRQWSGATGVRVDEKFRPIQDGALECIHGGVYLACRKLGCQAK